MLRLTLTKIIHIILILIGGIKMSRCGNCLYHTTQQLGYENTAKNQALVIATVVLSVANLAIACIGLAGGFSSCQTAMGWTMATLTVGIFISNLAIGKIKERQFEIFIQG